MSEKGAGKGFSVGKGGKSTPSSTNGDSSQVGRGGKAATGKNSNAKETVKHDVNVMREFPKNSQCLMDCEAADILQGIQEHMVILSRDPTLKLPIAFDKGLQYAKSGAQYSNPESVRRALEPLKKHGVADDGICIIANTCPETANEILAFLPALKEKRNRLVKALEDALGKLQELKSPTDVI